MSLSVIFYRFFYILVPYALQSASLIGIKEKRYSFTGGNSVKTSFLFSPSEKRSTGMRKNLLPKGSTLKERICSE